LVHDVAAQLTAALQQRHPKLIFDRSAVLYGAATHDIGKVVHPTELTGQGPPPSGLACSLIRRTLVTQSRR